MNVTSLRAPGGAQRLMAQFETESREHTHLAREIHDAVSSHVVAAYLLAGCLKDGSRDTGTGETVTHLCEELALALRDLRSFCFILDQQDTRDVECRRDFRTILEGLALRANLNFSFSFAACEDDISLVLKQVMMRILQEALVNVVRHANATEVHVSVVPRGEEVVLEVRDNGTGIVPGAKPGVGLRSIKRRAGAVGGGTRIESDCSGTIVTAWFPMAAA